MVLTYLDLNTVISCQTGRAEIKSSHMLNKCNFDEIRWTCGFRGRKKRRNRNTSKEIILEIDT